MVHCRRSTTFTVWPNIFSLTQIDTGSILPLRAIVRMEHTLYRSWEQSLRESTSNSCIWFLSILLFQGSYSVSMLLLQRCCIWLGPGKPLTEFYGTWTGLGISMKMVRIGRYWKVDCTWLWRRRLLWWCSIFGQRGCGNYLLKFGMQLDGA